MNTCVMLSDNGEHPLPEYELFNTIVVIDGLDSELCAIRVECIFCGDWWASACNEAVAHRVQQAGFSVVTGELDIEWVRNVHARAKKLGFDIGVTAILKQLP